MAFFNKDNNGAAELQSLTGVYYAANSYELIAGEIHDASREVAEIIGEGVAQRAEQAYNSGTDTELVRAVQTPIACLAMSRYFRQTIISHEDSGRKLKIDENEKVPFEWMLDRDDKAMRERYFRSLDSLFAYLDKAKIAEWENSRMYNLTKLSIVRNIHDFEAIYPIEQSRYTFFMLLPLIVEVQATKLHRVLGDVWERINGETVEDKDRNLLHCAQRVAVLEAVLIAVERWSIEVFPQSVARRFLPTYQGHNASHSATTTEIDWYLNKLRAQADEAMQDIMAEVRGGNQYKDLQLHPENSPKKKYFTAGM